MPKRTRKTEARHRKARGKSKPVSFRLELSLTDQLDGLAKRFGITRNNLVALVLQKYLTERVADIEEAVKEDEARARHPDLFA